MENPLPSPFNNAELYDLLFHDFDYGIDFYLQQARAAAGPVLEVACGTGRVLLPLLRAGIEADGLDAFAPMLERARRKAEAEGRAPHLYLAEMKGFRLPRRYALVIIPFNAFVHNLTQEDQLSSLRTIREHLLPGGKLVFDLFYPAPEYFAQPCGVPVLELETTHPETGLPIRIYDTRTLELVEQIQRSENEIQELDREGNLLRSHRSQTSIRWIFKPEMELLLRLAGYAKWEITRGFEAEPLTGAAETMVVSAQA